MAGSSDRSGGQAFTHLTLDRAGEYRDDPHWVDARRTHPASRFLWLDRDLRLAVDAASDAPYWLRPEQCRHGDASLLGHDDAHTWFVVADDRDTPMTLPSADHADGIVWLDLREAASRLHAFHAGLFAYARALCHWQAMTRFCGRCGAPLQLVAAGHRAECHAPQCGHVHFPRTDPAIIVIVENAGACLLGRQPSWPQERYSALAGFVEPGETLEGAVAREVHEETGVHVRASTYCASQPWPFPASLMLGFAADAHTREITLRDGELADARWFTPEDIVDGVRDGTLHLPGQASIARQLLAQWLNRRAGIDLDAVQLQ